MLTVLGDHERGITEFATMAMAIGIMMEHNRTSLAAATARLHELAQILSVPVSYMASAIIDTHPLTSRSGGSPGDGSTDDA